MALSFIDDGAQVGEGTVIYPHVYVGRSARIGRNCILYPGVKVRERCILGDRVIVHSNTVIGSDDYSGCIDECRPADTSMELHGWACGCRRGYECDINAMIQAWSTLCSVNPIGLSSRVPK